MERHSLHNSEGHEITETKEIFNILSIEKEEIEINTEIYEKSNENLCLNDNDYDNSIPFCNILLSKFLDLTTENDSTSTKKKVNAARTEATKTSGERVKLYRQRQRMKKTELQDGKKEVAIKVAIDKIARNAERSKRYRERKKLENIELYLAKKRKNNAAQYQRYKEKEKVDIELAIIKRTRNAEKQKRHREKKRLENLGKLYSADELKKHAEVQKRYRQRLKMEKNKLQNDKKEVDIEVAVFDKSEKNAENSKRYREREKMKKIELQNEKREVDVEAAINKRKKAVEWQRRYRERKKLENNDNQRKKDCEWMRRFRERKKEENPELYKAKRAEAQRLYRQKKKELQNVNEKS
ncbi:trichohyalin-like isoform X2 [Belonocnema kinseyi]|uniref:trichohyalin-like isoform X2 n=1 Tax=Belonocnema kinseyi TaxID=2817044 RepID=UPI00143D4B45|nr:trichohyalin-like isoform X2 [Belonocnema kinseyi]